MNFDLNALPYKNGESQLFQIAGSEGVAIDPPGPLVLCVRKEKVDNGARYFIAFAKAQKPGSAIDNEAIILDALFMRDELNLPVGFPIERGSNSFFGPLTVEQADRLGQLGFAWVQLKLAEDVVRQSQETMERLSAELAVPKTRPSFLRVVPLREGPEQ